MLYISVKEIAKLTDSSVSNSYKLVSKINNLVSTKNNELITFKGKVSIASASLYLGINEDELKDGLKTIRKQKSDYGWQKTPICRLTIGVRDLITRIASKQLYHI